MNRHYENSRAELQNVRYRHENRESEDLHYAVNLRVVGSNPT